MMEVNQPLTAIVSYMAAARRIAARERVAGGLAEAIDAAAAAARRAGEIIRRVRDMTGKGRSLEGNASMEEVILEAVALATAGLMLVAIAAVIAALLTVDIAASAGRGINRIADVIEGRLPPSVTDLLEQPGAYGRP